MKLACDFIFDAAHRILGHSGKCAYLHGHTYRLEVTVSAAELDALGMVTSLAFTAIREALPAGITLERVAVCESPGCGSALSRGEA